MENVNRDLPTPLIENVNTVIAFEKVEWVKLLRIKWVQILEVN